MQIEFSILQLCYFFKIDTNLIFRICVAYKIWFKRGNCDVLRENPHGLTFLKSWLKIEILNGEMKIEIRKD